MTAENTSIQGSLFLESEENFLNNDSLQKTKTQSDLDLNEENLTKDAELRPRKRNKTEKKSNFIENQPEGNPQEDQLPWSHHTLVEIQELSPVMRHYVELKGKHPDKILLYRLGDFFECFFEDAINLSQILELTLTGKEGGKNIGRVPMAGIPHHSVERYCSTLIQKGISVAICDQLESVQNKAGKLLKRGITRILTPGTILEEGMLHAKKNNWLAAILIESKPEEKNIKWGLARADISTGEFFIQEGEGINALEQEILNIDASEIICETLEMNIIKKLKSKNISFSKQSQTSFSFTEAEALLKKYYQLKTINGLGIKDHKLALRASGGLLSYLNETNPIENTEFKETISKVSLEFPKINNLEEHLIIDSQTRRNLEITKTQRDGHFQGSLLWAIDRTHTAMGGRCLRQWLEKPLIRSTEILERQKIVSLLVDQKQLRKVIRRLLRTMGDLERLSGRASAGQAGARDLIAIANSLQRLPKLSANLHDISISHPKWMQDLIDVNPNLIQLAAEIKDTIIDDPPLSITDGGFIHDGVDSILDGLRNQIDDQNKWLKEQELNERKICGNSNLKLQYHRTFGYFLAVSKSKASEVPSHWIRRQTLANEERFITPALKEREGRIFELKLRSSNREYDLFCQLRQLVGKNAHAIRQASKAVAGLDVLAGLSELAATNNYCSPRILDFKNKSTSREITLYQSRHPVVEQNIVEEVFQPNDLKLGDSIDLMILTGPNASGKSCYLRQIGLIQLLFQIGSWIPAKNASLSIADRIFTRVGAVDDLAAGQSTFMVEMTETAFILNQATKHSLVLLDEIGRGTSTFDGLSIAWSVSEFLAENIQSRTIFATHYHELNDLCKKLNNVANFQVLVEETGEELYFLHKVVQGGSKRSYGIEAARLAGVPKAVIKKAKKILEELESKNSN